MTQRKWKERSTSVEIELDMGVFFFLRAVVVWSAFYSASFRSAGVGLVHAYRAGRGGDNPTAMGFS